MKTTRFFLWLGLCLPCCGLLPIAAVEVKQPSISPEYFAVLRSGDVRQLRTALDQGSPVNARDARGNTPLLLATVYADASCVRLLLDRGAEVNVTNAAGATPLMHAAFDYEKVRLLVKRGAKVNARSALGDTALMLAARPVNSYRAVELLLSHGADAKATNNWGANALMAAAAGGDSVSVRLLLKSGANPNAQPVADPGSFVLGGGRSALMWAAYRGDIAIMEQLIASGADVNGEGFLGTPLTQAAWNDRVEATRLLIKHGAKINQVSHGDGYTALHWAASTERSDDALVKLLLNNGADAKLGGGEHVDAFMGELQTPAMLAQRRGETRILAELLSAGATKESPDSIRDVKPPARQLPERLNIAAARPAISRALPPLQSSSLKSKQAFVNHSSKQDCTSCHQQYLPLAAIGLAKKRQIPVDTGAERQLLEIVREGDLKNIESDWQPLFHPEPVYSKGYLLFGNAGDEVPANEFTDSAVHHIAVIQGRDGRWFENLPRPPIQSGDVGATALAIHALQHYPLPGRKAEFSERVDRARRWLWTVKAEHNEDRVYQILGLAWAGESTRRLQSLANSLLAEQRTDGGWAQLPALKTDAYATGQAVYALRVGAGMPGSQPEVQQALRYLLINQLEDGTWYVHRRAFPFQPTMNSGFPHGRDSWISSAATSWAVLALSLADEPENVADGGAKVRVSQ